MRLRRALAPALTLTLIMFAGSSLGAGAPERLVVKPYPDKPAWKRITDKSSAGGWIHEQIPGGETEIAFTKILTDQGFVANRGVDPAAFLQNIFAGIGGACDGAIVNGPTRQLEGGYKVAYGQVYCGTQKGETVGVHIFYKVIEGDAALYSVSWEDHVPPSANGGELSFPKGQEARAKALLNTEAAANGYLTKDVYVCGGRSSDPRCGR